MYRRSVATIKVKIQPGKANMGELARALGPTGIKTKDFVDEFNLKTKELKISEKVIVKIYIDEKKKYTFAVGTPSVSSLIKKKLGLDKGSTAPGSIIISTITSEQAKEISQEKFGHTGEFNTVLGTAVSMGIKRGNDE